MSEPTWLDYVTAFGAVATPILVLILAGIGWKIRARLERTFALEDQLREDRIATYNEILEPFILFLTPDAVWNSDPKNKNKNKDKFAVATQNLLSLQYRKQCFKLALMGSDGVVKAFNELFQFFYKSSDASNPLSETELKRGVTLLGSLLLEIRKSMGNEATKLDSWDMLEWWITDIRNFRP
jgi:hypothetical protein